MSHFCAKSIYFLCLFNAVMSADDKESSILRGLEAGAAFYIVKPVNYDDLKDLWQYALSPRKGKSVVIREIESAQGHH